MARRIDLKFALGAAVVIGVAVLLAARGPAPPPGNYPFDRVPPQAWAPLTCADLPGIQKEIDALADWPIRHLWAVLMLLTLIVLGVFKVLELCGSALMGIGAAAQWAWKWLKRLRAQGVH